MKIFLLSIACVWLSIGTEPHLIAETVKPVASEVMEASATRVDPPNYNFVFPFDNAHSHIGFEAGYMKFGHVRGRFTNISGTVIYNPEKPEETSVAVIVHIASLTTHLEFRDKDLKSDQWFDAEKFPHATFTSTSVASVEEGLMVTGMLKIRDVEKEITFSMQTIAGIMADMRGDSQVIFAGEFTVNRKEFGIKGERWSKVRNDIMGVSEEIKVTLNILGKRFEEANYKNFLGKPDGPMWTFVNAYNEKGFENAWPSIKGFHDSGRLRPAHLNRIGVYYLVTGETQKAYDIFKENNKLFEDEWMTWDSLGEGAYAVGDYDAAKKAFKKALELDPFNGNAMAYLAVMGG